MATYIQGLTDYIPQIQPYKPDLNLYSKVIQTLDERYDTNYKKISEYWGKLMSMPLSRTDNIERRKKFFDDVNNEIQKVSGLDLTLEQNVDAALQIFEPLVNDKYMINDWVKTKQKEQALKQHEYYKNRICDDPKKCGYQRQWDGNLRLLDYWTADFNKVSPDDALKMASPEYVPLVDVFGMATDDAKAQGFNVVFDDPSGAFVVRNKNGNLIAPSLQQYFIGRFGSDPNVMRYMRGVSELERRDYIQNALPQFNGNEALAQQDYAKNNLERAIKNIKSEKLKADDEKEEIDNYLLLYKDYVEQNGILPTDKSAIAQAGSAMQRKQQIDQTSTVLTAQDEELNNYMLNYFDFINDGRKLDNIISYDKLKHTMAAAANAYANLNAERTIQMANPYEVMRREQQHAINMAYRKEVHDVNMAYLQNDLQKDLEKYKKKVEKEADLEKMGLYQPIVIENVPGGSTSGGETAFQMNIDRNNALHADISGLQADYASNIAYDMLSLYDDQSTTSIQKNGIKAILNKSFNGLGISIDRLLNPETRGEELKKIKASSQNPVNTPKISAAYQTLGSVFNDKAYSFLSKINVNNQYDIASYKINQQIKNREIFTRDRKEDAKTVVNDLLANNVEGSLMISKVMEHSTNGFWPTENQKEAIATKISKQYPAEKQETIKAVILNNWDNAKNTFNQAYGANKNVRAWNQDPRISGKAANAVAGQGVGYRFDYSVWGNGSTTNSTEDILRDADAAADNNALIIGFGNGDTKLTESDADALAIYNGIIKNRHGYTKGDDPRTFKGYMTYQNIAQGNKDYIGVTLTLDEQMLESLKGTKDYPGIARSIKRGQTITMRIPKEYAKNLQYQSSEITNIEYGYNKNGVLIVDPYEGVNGSTTVKKTAGGHQMAITAKIFNPGTGSYDVRTETRFVPENVEIDAITDMLINVYTVVNNQNKTSIKNVSAATGIKDFKTLVDMAAAQLQQ